MKVLYYVHLNEEAVVVRFHIDVVNEAAHDREKRSSHWGAFGNEAKVFLVNCRQSSVL